VSLKTFIAISSAFVAASAIAQAPSTLGSVSSVQGNVTVSNGNSLIAAVQGAPITSGMRFVTPSNGLAALRLNNGCVVNLRPNQAVTVLQSMTCDQLLAAVQTVGPVNVAAASGGSAGTGALATGGLLAGGLIAIKSISSR
jgi:hypothetical protein